MQKRRASGPKTARKKKKGNATYALASLDPISEDEVAAEDIRVWNISTSEATGRVMASRRTLRHHRQVLPNSLEGPSISETPGGAGESADIEDVGVLADSESSKKIKGQRPKRRRVRTFKENDSVSRLPVSPVLWLTRVSRQRWNSGFYTVPSILTNRSVVMVWAMNG